MQLIKLTSSPIEGHFKAYIRTSGKTGIIDAKYISKQKRNEVKENGFAWVKQPKERVV